MISVSFRCLQIDDVIIPRADASNCVDVSLNEQGILGNANIILCRNKASLV